MIKLEELVSAVHLAVKSANEALQGQSTKFIDQFFETVSADEINQLKGENSRFDLLKDQSYLRPKMVRMEYPMETAEGIQSIGVDVPLISVVPMASTRIEEMEFRTGLDVIEDLEGNLQVSFAKKEESSGFFGRSESTPPATELSIKLRGDESPEGLQKLIEGYNRALRAQIPG